MITQVAWLDREFVFSQPIGMFPIALERLRGTPARAKQLVSGVREDVLARRIHDKWSVKEHLGHLTDLEPLDDRRLDEFLNRAEVLSAADIENRATENGNHRRIPTVDITQRLAAGRDRLIRRLEMLTEKEIEITARHPRLQKPMRLLDWAYFLAEHDDHHLALARSVIAELNNQRFR
jgi:hypothetical protein